MSVTREQVLDWLLAADPTRLRRETLAEGNDSLAAHLRRHGQDALAAQLAAVDKEGGAPTPAPTIEFALAEALAEFVTLNPSHHRFQAVEQLLHHEKLVWHSFQDRTVDILRSNAPRLAALRDRLDSEPDLILSDLSSVALHSRWSPSELAWHHANTASVRDMWQSAGYANMHMTSHVEYRILRLADPIGWLGIVERFTLPQPVFDLVEGGALDDALEIAAMLAAASPAFDDAGSWDRRSIISFQLLTAAERVLQRHAGLISNGGPGDGAAFAAAVDAVVSALAGRADATWLGHAWLQQLAWEDRIGRAWHRQPATDDQAGLWRLMTAVAARLAPLSDTVAWIEAEDDIWRCDRLVVCLLPNARGASPSAATDILTSVIGGNLVPSTSLTCALRNADTAFVRTTAAALSAVGDPSGWFRAAWLDCFAARDRLRTWHGGTEGKRLDPGALAASCACALLIRTAGEEERRAATMALWETLCRSVVEAFLTNVGPKDGIWTLLARWLALTFAEVHVTIGDAERIKRLKFLLTPLRSTSNIFLQLLRDLVDRGIVAEIDAALEGPPLQAVIQRTLTDARRAGQTDFDGKQALAALEKLATHLLTAAGAAGPGGSIPPPLARPSP